ncbi:unnamed protein product [Caretta caretta]
MEPTIVQDDLVSWDGALLAPESSMETEGSPSAVSDCGLFLKVISEQALGQEQQQYILSPLLRGADASPKEQPSAEPAIDTDSTKAALKPAGSFCGLKYPSQNILKFSL